MLSQVFRDYSTLFTLYNTGELSCTWMGANGFKAKIGNEFCIVVCSRCRQNLKFGKFEIHGNSCCTDSTIICSFSTNDTIISLWRCRCSGRRLCLNSLWPLRSKTVASTKTSPQIITLLFRKSSRLFHLVYVLQCGRIILKINWDERFPSTNIREVYGKRETAGSCLT